MQVKALKHKKIFKPSNTSMDHAFRLLKLDWPSAEIVIKRVESLAIFLEQISCTKINDAAIVKIIENALTAYTKMIASGRNDNLPDAIRLYVFINTLFDGVVELIKNEHLAKYGKKLSIDGKTTSKLRMALYMLMVTENLQDLFMRCGFEKQILDAGPTVCN